MKIFRLPPLVAAIAAAALQTAVIGYMVKAALPFCAMARISS